jgi:hypothetical protein
VVREQLAREQAHARELLEQNRARGDLIEEAREGVRLLQTRLCLDWSQLEAARTALAQYNAAQDNAAQILQVIEAQLPTGTAQDQLAETDEILARLTQAMSLLPRE